MKESKEKWVTPTQKEKGEKKPEMEKEERREYLAEVRKEAEEMKEMVEKGEAKDYEEALRILEKEKEEETIKMISGFKKYLDRELNEDLGDYEGSFHLDNFAANVDKKFAAFILERHRWRPSYQGGIEYSTKIGAIKDGKIIDSSYIKVRDMDRSERDDFSKWYSELEIQQIAGDKAAILFKSGKNLDTYEFDFKGKGYRLLESEDRKKVEMEKKEKEKPFEKLPFEEQIVRTMDRLRMDSYDPTLAVPRYQFEGESWNYSSDLEEGERKAPKDTVLILLENARYGETESYAVYLFKKGWTEPKLLRKERGTVETERDWQGYVRSARGIITPSIYLEKEDDKLVVKITKWSEKDKKSKIEKFDV